jgi:hypothetical protein
LSKPSDRGRSANAYGERKTGECTKRNCGRGTQCCSALSLVGTQSTRKACAWGCELGPGEKPEGPRAIFADYHFYHPVGNSNTRVSQYPDYGCVRRLRRQIGAGPKRAPTVESWSTESPRMRRSDGRAHDRAPVRRCPAFGFSRAGNGGPETAALSINQKQTMLSHRGCGDALFSRRDPPPNSGPPSQFCLTEAGILLDCSGVAPRQRRRLHPWMFPPLRPRAVLLIRFSRCDFPRALVVSGMV